MSYAFTEAKYPVTRLDRLCDAAIGPKPAGLTNGSFLAVIVRVGTNASSLDEERPVPSLSSTNEGWTLRAPSTQAMYMPLSCLHSNNVLMYT